MSNRNEAGTNNVEVTPESLMDRFKGPGLMKMVIVTIVFHVVLILGTSLAYLKKSFFGTEIAAMTKEQRVEKALEEATSSIRKIATENGLNPQDISEKFSSPAARAAKAAASAPAGGATASTNAPAVNATAAKPEKDVNAAKPDRPESAIEKDLKKAVKGPDAPPAVGKDDIF